MNFDRKKYKSFALMQLKGRWKPAIIGTIITLIILTAFTITNKKTSNISYSELASYDFEQLLNFYKNAPELSPPAIILNIIQTIVSFIVEMVLVAFFLIFSRSPDPVSMKNYFEGYNKWARGILCGLWRGLWTFLWGLIAVPIYLGATLLYLFSPVTLPMAVEGFLFLIIIIAAFIPMFIKSIEYSFIFFFASEFPEVGIRKALRLSITITKGHRWDIFVLELSFIGWILLSIISFGIGACWVIPYYYLTLTNTYHALLQDALEGGKVLPEDLN